MSESAGKVLEGVFAIKKPPSLSSAQVLRDLQNAFAKSSTFAPLLRETNRQNELQSKRRRLSKETVFKMGHGGTLDPLATGVLIVGLGRGTKALPNFLGGTKTYETVVLFGKTTNTYDVAGQIVASAPYSHITQTMVEEKLSKFRGHIKQVPPIYSALKINGMKAYDYARTGKPLPRELESRDMVVEECELLEYYEPGTHDFRWPAAEASAEDQDAARRLLNVEAQTVLDDTPRETPEKAGSSGSGPAQNSTIDNNTGKFSRDTIDKLNQMTAQEKAALHTHDVPELCKEAADAPAARVRLTSSSGFYVRSFAHDLGLACESYGTMSELTRVRQSNYTINNPPPEGQVLCLTYDDLEKGEDAWGPKIGQILQNWMEANPVMGNGGRIDDRDRKDHRYSKRGGSFKNNNRHKQSAVGYKRKREQDTRRRNSSSPE